MKVYVEAKSKAALIRRLAAGEEISGYNYSMFGGGGHYMLDDTLEDGTIIAIYSQMSQGNPVAKSWGTWTNGVLKAETFGGSGSCSVCGSDAVHYYKNGEIQLCDKHYQQQFGRYSAESSKNEDKWYMKCKDVPYAQSTASGDWDSEKPLHDWSNVGEDGFNYCGNCGQYYSPETGIVSDGKYQDLIHGDAWWAESLEAEGCPLCGKIKPHCINICDTHGGSVKCKCGKQGWSICAFCEQVTCEPHTLSTGNTPWDDTICPDCAKVEWEAELFSADSISLCGVCSVAGHQCDGQITGCPCCEITAKRESQRPTCNDCGKLKSSTPQEYNRWTCWPCRDAAGGGYHGTECYCNSCMGVEYDEDYNAETFEAPISCGKCGPNNGKKSPWECESCGSSYLRFYEHFDKEGRKDESLDGFFCGNCELSPCGIYQTDSEPCTCDISEYGKYTFLGRKPHPQFPSQFDEDARMRILEKKSMDAETFESPVSCKICGKTFASFRGLNGHMNAHIPSHRKRAETFEAPKKTKEEIISYLLSNCEDYDEYADPLYHTVNDKKWTIADLFIRQWLNNGWDGFGMNNVEEVYGYLVDNKELLIEYDLVSPDGINNSGFPLWHNYDFEAESYGAESFFVKLAQAKKEVMTHYGDEGWEDDEYEEVIERRLDGYCIECSEPFHASCGMVSRDEGCSCCDNTRDSLNEHGMDAEECEHEWKMTELPLERGHKYDVGWVNAAGITSYHMVCSKCNYCTECYGPHGFSAETFEAELSEWLPYEIITTDWKSSIAPENRHNNDNWFITGDIIFAVPDHEGHYGRGNETIVRISTYGEGTTLDEAKENGIQKSIRYLYEDYTDYVQNDCYICGAGDGPACDSDGCQDKHQSYRMDNMEAETFEAPYAFNDDRCDNCERSVIDEQDMIRMPIYIGDSKYDVCQVCYDELIDTNNDFGETYVSFAAQTYCNTCQIPGHESCSLTDGCPCCENTMIGIYRRAEDEDEPTIEEFFREMENTLNKYGEWDWDSEARGGDLHISVNFTPFNGENFYQYDLDFDEMREDEETFEASGWKVTCSKCGVKGHNKSTCGRPKPKTPKPRATKSKGYVRKTIDKDQARRRALIQVIVGIGAGIFIGRNL